MDVSFERRGRNPSIDCTLVSWAHALILHHIICHRRRLSRRYLLAECPYFYGLPTAAGNSLHILFSDSPQSLLVLATTQDSNMDLLVAGLRDIEPCGLYQYGSLVDRKRKDIRSVGTHS
jgi:hypothetical protein